jgi:hypothetical protein
MLQGHGAGHRRGTAKGTRALSAIADHRSISSGPRLPREGSERQSALMHRDRAKICLAGPMMSPANWPPAR